MTQAGRLSTATLPRDRAATPPSVCYRSSRWDRSPDCGSPAGDWSSNTVRWMPDARAILANARLIGAFAVGLTVAVGGCSFPSSPQSHTDRATLAACRDYASQVYDRQNRGTIYSINQTGLPYSSNYQVDYQTNTLAARFQNEQVIDDCVRNTGTETSRDNPAQSSSDRPQATSTGAPAAPPKP